MNFKIVSDSSANLFSMEGVDFESVPMKICTQEREFVDDPALDVGQMVEYLRNHNGRSGSSCPNTQEWLDAFGDADCIFAVTITSNLSGSNSAAEKAKEEYLRTHENARVCVLDTLSAGPEILLILEKLQELIRSGLDFDRIESQIRDYMARTRLFFSLKSMVNLARNGRCSPAAAVLAGALGIRAVGRASEEGTLELMHKCRGDKHALKTIIDSMKRQGFAGGRVRIAHCMNPEGSDALGKLLLAEYPQCDVRIGECGGLCSFYAERGGFLLGFEVTM